MANKIKDITGQKFGKLTVIGKGGYTATKRKSILWLCRCECGNEVFRTSAHLRQNYNSTCGKCNKINDEDYINKTYGYWTIISSAKSKSRKKSFLCRCKCGNERVVNLDTLLLGKSQSCGCFHREMMKNKLTTHGQTGNRIMTIYFDIKNRCYCENNNRFKDYGARGIKMCEEWKNNSSLFVEWAFANGYSDELSIDRIDVDGNYCPENCRWITIKEQSQNKRNSIKFTFFGITKNLKQWCECINEDYAKMYARHYRKKEVFKENEIKKIREYIENGGG